MGERINKLWHIHAMEYYSAMKRNKLLRQAIIWMNLKGILLSEKLHDKGYILDILKKIKP